MSPIEDRDLTLALGHRDWTHLDIDLSYYPTDNEDIIVTPRVQPFILRDGPRPRIQIVWVNDSTPYLLRLTVFPSVKYVCIRNMLSSTPIVQARVEWTDNISGDYCTTTMNGGDTLVIPNPRKYDADTGLYGITISTTEEQVDIPIYIVAVGSEA